MICLWSFKLALKSFAYLRVPIAIDAFSPSVAVIAPRTWSAEQSYASSPKASVAVCCHEHDAGQTVQKEVCSVFASCQALNSRCIDVHPCFLASDQSSR